MIAKKIFQVVGARPNFIKVAPIHRAIAKHDRLQSVIVHTGQHSDYGMSGIFIQQLGLPNPDFFLDAGTGSHSQLTARIMQAFEKTLLSERPDLVIVVGDVTSTLACALTAAQLQIPIAHVEAGLRSFDKAMPEEINRKLTDHISDLLFVTEESGLVNLKNENIDQEKIFFVGNCMIDSLAHIMPRLNAEQTLQKFKLKHANYALMTMHRPSNVDTAQGLQQLIQLIRQTVQHIPVVFPMHPRTQDKLKTFALDEAIRTIKHLEITDPLPYEEFISLMQHAKLIITDSGGVQEEATYLKIPCLTLRKTTERPVTAEVGTNILVDDLSIESAVRHINSILDGNIKPSQIPYLWDGKAADRIVSHLLNFLCANSQC